MDNAGNYFERQYYDDNKSTVMMMMTKIDKKTFMCSSNLQKLYLSFWASQIAMWFWLQIGLNFQGKLKHVESKTIVF